MTTLEHYLEEQLSHGRSYFCKEEALEALGCSAKAFTAAATRMTKKQRLVSPWRGFYLILRPEDRISGAPDPVRWIDPLMKYLQLAYRISLLRAAAFHGSTHQAAMVFQVVVPKQLRGFDIGRHRIQFIYQTPSVFGRTNQPELLEQLKSDTGFAKIAGVELVLLDSARYFHKTGGIHGIAQIVHDVGRRANPRKLHNAAAAFENSAVRRLGYLLDHFGHSSQSKSLAPFVRQAKSVTLLDPSVKPLIEGLPTWIEKNTKWMLIINESLEVDL